jgi:hypothetical protein
VAVNCPGSVTNQHTQAVGTIVEVGQQTSGLLGGPRTVWVGGHTHRVYKTGAHFNDEEGVVVLEGRRAVDGKEVDGEHAGRLRERELSPGEVGGPSWCGRYPAMLQYSADAGRADAVAELARLAFDASVASTRILLGETFDQCRELRILWPVPALVWVGPFRRDQASTPTDARCQG